MGLSPFLYEGAMKSVIITVLLAFSAWGANSVITQSIVGADGQVATGVAVINTTAPCKSGTQMVGDKDITVRFQAGAFTVSLIPTDTCVTTGSTFGSAWSSVTAYAIGARVQYGNLVYMARIASTNVQPGSDKTTWLQISPTYTAKFKLINGEEWEDQLAVPTSGTVLSLDAVRVSSSKSPAIAVVGAQGPAGPQGVAGVVTGTPPVVYNPSTKDVSCPTCALISDPRLTNARTPTAHALSHEAGGSDQVVLDLAHLDGTSYVNGFYCVKVTGGVITLTTVGCPGSSSSVTNGMTWNSINMTWNGSVMTWN